MNYEAPQIELLGDATSVIQGAKPGAGEGTQLGAFDCELDD